MDKFLTFFFISMIYISMQSQTHEIGVFVGGSNYIGDIGTTEYIAPNTPALGFVYKWDKSKRHAYRFSAITTNLMANDAQSKNAARKQRGYKFSNNFTEISAGLEFNFFNFDLFKSDSKITPYIYSGLNFILYDKTHFENNVSKKDAMAGNFAVPFIIGIKWNMSERYILALETGVRYAITDNLDGSHQAQHSYLQFGNLQGNDWYVFSGITLTYTFGHKKCYCPQNKKWI